MRQGQFWEQFAQQTDMDEETLPGHPIVELSGDRKVFIEGHCGICEYGCERIGIAMKYGILQICGYGLELSRMTRETLVIRGRIDCLLVKRGNGR